MKCPQILGMVHKINKDDNAERWKDTKLVCYLFCVPESFRVLYGNKITEIPQGLFDDLVSLQLL